MPSANAPVIDLTSDTEEDEVMVVDESESTEAVREEDLETVDRQHAHLFRLLSWNIDGLSVQSRDFRTPAVVDLIKRFVKELISVFVFDLLQICLKSTPNKISLAGVLVKLGQSTHPFAVLVCWSYLVAQSMAMIYNPLVLFFVGFFC